MDRDELNKLVEEAATLSVKQPFILRDFLFPEQLSFALDPARFATAASARSGSPSWRFCVTPSMNCARRSLPLKPHP